MRKNDRFSYLLQQYTSGGISNDEQDELFEMLSSSHFESTLADTIQKELQEGSFDKNADLPPHIAQEIIRNIFKAEKNTAHILPIKKSYKAWKWMAVAASVILIVLSGYFFFYSAKKSSKDVFASLIPHNTISKYNATPEPEIISLPDGSKITLQPKSTLHYPVAFNGGSREVYLEGEAFFNVTKNPQQPFLVYYNNIITKVLGTSFIINTNPGTGNVEVVVKTGRVQVSENEKLVKGQMNNAVIVTPNQKAIYKINTRLFETTLVDKPEPVTGDDANGMAPTHNRKEIFIFNQEKLANVFRQLENSYRIEIVPENANLNNCLFTGDVNGQDLYTKLKIICLTTNSSYEINGTKILIKGKGCE